MSLHSIGIAKNKGERPSYLGTAGHMATFAWLIGMVMLAPLEKVTLAAIICLPVVLVVYPKAILRSLRFRWLAWMLLLSLPTLFFLGELDANFMGIRYSSEGLQAGWQIAIRFIMVLAAVQGFTSSVDITALAGLLERFGLQGLGFSIGVALNLLPFMQQSYQDTWRCLRMRGGLRKRWRQGLRLFSFTVISNALRRAEEVALAAETRAFSPEKARPLPVSKGTLDWLPLILGVVSILLLVFL
jgi:energy-coupling factor transporter transmembrane protein EcfT